MLPQGGTKLGRRLASAVLAAFLSVQSSSAGWHLLTHWPGSCAAKGAHDSATSKLICENRTQDGIASSLSSIACGACQAARDLRHAGLDGNSPTVELGLVLAGQSPRETVRLVAEPCGWGETRAPPFPV